MTSLPVLSYVVNTRNKLQFLRIAMQRLLAHAGVDEEIVVVDGGSTDGSAEFLADLRSAGKIQQFLSEPDVGEAHGWNKGLLLAQGTLIKIITDDDVFHYPGIRACRQYMLEHSEIDWLGSDIGVLGASGELEIKGATKWYQQWECRSNPAPFEFCGITLLLRRSSLPLLGLFDTGSAAVDAEFSARNSCHTSKANLGWYAGALAVHRVTQTSGVVTRSRQLDSTRLRINAEYSNYDSATDLFKNAVTQAKAGLSMLKVHVKDGLRRIEFLYGIFRSVFPVRPNGVWLDNDESRVVECERWMTEYSRRHPSRFYVNIRRPPVGESATKYQLS
jgi:glycosyltransferase involved in cell wall biosynthesis